MCSSTSKKTNELTQETGFVKVVLIKLKRRVCFVLLCFFFCLFFCQTHFAARVQDWSRQGLGKLALIKAGVSMRGDGSKREKQGCSGCTQGNISGVRRK